MKTVKAILFDLDGTLIDSETSHYNCWNALLSAYGERLDHDLYMKDYSGVALAINAQKLIDTYHLDVRLAELVQRREEMMLKTFRDDEISMMPYAMETIAFFYKKTIPLALVTSSSRAEVAAILEKSCLKNIFTYTVTRDDVMHVKPHPEPYLRAVALLGCRKEDCIVIEDTASGISSAKSAGLTCFAVQQAPSTTGAERVFTDLGQAKAYLCANYLF